MITSIGTYPNFFNFYLPDLQKAFSVFDSKAWNYEAAPIGCTSVFLSDSVIEIDRRDGDYHVDSFQMIDWHQEGVYEEQDDGTLIDLFNPVVMMWSNIYQTEFLLPTGDIFTPQPFELVMVDNKIVKHRTPTIPSEELTNRHFIAARFGITPNTRQLNKFRKALKAAE